MSNHHLPWCTKIKDQVGDGLLTQILPLTHPASTLNQQGGWSQSRRQKHGVNQDNASTQRSPVFNQRLCYHWKCRKDVRPNWLREATNPTPSRRYNRSSTGMSQYATGISYSTQQCKINQGSLASIKLTLGFILGLSPQSTLILFFLWIPAHLADSEKGQETIKLHLAEQTSFVETVCLTVRNKTNNRYWAHNCAVTSRFFIPLR